MSRQRLICETSRQGTTLFNPQELDTDVLARMDIIAKLQADSPEKGKVSILGSEPRRFAIARCGRLMIVTDDGPMVIDPLGMIVVSPAIVN